MAENHVTVRLSSDDLRELHDVVNGNTDSVDFSGSINGQSITVRFRAWEPFEDERLDADGEVLPYGRCDTCGVPCDENGCTNNRDHEVANYA